MAPRVLFYDAPSAGADLPFRPRWLEATAPRRQLRAQRLDEVLETLAEAEAEADNGAWVAGFLSYEAGPAFESALEADARPRPDGLPLAWFGVFDSVREVDPPPTGSPPTLDWRAALAERDYLDAVEAVHRHIAAGDTYQVNLTFALEATWPGPAPKASPAPRATGSSDPADELFAALWHAQGGAHSALVDLGEVALLSASPELFFERDGRRIRTRPMKGTTPRGRFPAEDAARAAALHSEKNHAENLMIVDMLRNDLGRVAEPGSVRVERLFSAERYPTVHQLTSEIVARTDASTLEVFRALFPCASITGAPKISASRIIRRLEPTPRGVYTGAVGYLGPGRRARFGVAIRTVTLDRRSGVARYGVGGGIVADSDGPDELRECFAKARVLTARRPRFELLETMRSSVSRGVFLRERHLDRMAASARHFDRPFDRDRVDAALEAALAEARSREGAASDFDHAKLRLLLAADGTPRVEIHPLTANDTFVGLSTPPDAPPRIRVAIDTQPIDERDLFLFHKTTHRGVYLEARARHPEADDVLLWNRRGELTESTVANLVVRHGDRWSTPPVESGLLAGTYRDELLARGHLEERVLRRADLGTADGIYLVNSVRGWMEAVPPSPDDRRA